MMKVLMLGNHPKVKGGITSVITQIRRHDWEADGVDMTFIPTYIESNAVCKALFFAKAYVNVFFFLLLRRPDVVYFHMSYKGSFVRKYMIHRLCRLFHIRDVVHLHGSEFQKWYDILEENKKEQVRRMLRECHMLLVLGNEWKRRIEKIEPETSICVLNNTVSIPKVRVKWQEGKNKLLFLGVLIGRKGVADLIEAVHMLDENGQLDGWQLVIAGSGEEEAALRGLAEKYQLNDKIIFTGWIDGRRKRELMRDSQIFVLPSYNEGLPMAILESMSYGMPVVATDVGDVRAAVADQVNGYVVEPGNISQLADRLARLMADPVLWTDYSEQSKKSVKEKFDEKDYFARLLKTWA